MSAVTLRAFLVVLGGALRPTTIVTQRKFPMSDNIVIFNRPYRIIKNTVLSIDVGLRKIKANTLEDTGD